jgi:aerobic carbon-monoxide dehydrogenase small subunit
MNKIAISLSINGETHDLLVEPRRTLADVLRDQCGLTGTHLGCEHGVCGACTIGLDGAPARACLIFAVQAEGMEIRTVEGLARESAVDDLARESATHPLQRAFMRHHALQCGYCTPGFLMLLATSLEQNPDLTGDALRELISSNLCRCTGYQNIVAAAEDYAASLRAARSAA